MNTRFVKSNKSLSLIIKDSEFIRNIETKGIKITNLLNDSQARNRTPTPTMDIPAKPPNI